MDDHRSRRSDDDPGWRGRPGAPNRVDPPIGRRMVITGLAGSGKSTLARSLGASTGLPVIHLDLRFWKPGWVAPTDDEWRDIQRSIVADDAWILDGNYHETLALRLERADTVIVLRTPWPLCVARAVRRGIRRPGGMVMPEGCDDTAWRRLRDEWAVAGRVFRKRRWEPQMEADIIAEHGSHATVVVLRSQREVRRFLDRCRPGASGP